MTGIDITVNKFCCINSICNEIYKYKEYLKNCLNILKQTNFKSQSKKALPLIEVSEKFIY